MEKRDDTSTQDSIKGKRDNSIIKNFGFVVIVVMVLVVIGGYIFYTNRSAKKVEDIGNVNMDKGLSFEEKHKPGHSDSTIPEDEAEQPGRKHYNAGIRFSLRGDYDRAIEEYKKAIEYDPDVAEIYSNMGFAYLDKKDVERAITEQRKALELNPDLVNAYYGLALALEDKGDTKEALKNWEKYLELAPPGTVWWNKAKERLDSIKRDE